MCFDIVTLIYNEIESIIHGESINLNFSSAFPRERYDLRKCWILVLNFFIQKKEKKKTLKIPDRSNSNLLFLYQQQPSSIFYRKIRRITTRTRNTSNASTVSWKISSNAKEKKLYKIIPNDPSRRKIWSKKGKKKPMFCWKNANYH